MKAAQVQKDRRYTLFLFLFLVDCLWLCVGGWVCACVRVRFFFFFFFFLGGGQGGGGVVLFVVEESEPSM